MELQDFSCLAHSASLGTKGITSCSRQPCSDLLGPCLGWGLDKGSTHLQACKRCKAVCPGYIHRILADLIAYLL